MSRLALALVVLLPFGALAARPPDCFARCESDRKGCEVQCIKKAAKTAGPACKSMCGDIADPCRESC